MIFKKIITSIVLILVLSNTFSQTLVINELDSLTKKNGDLSFGLKNSNFFKDNEYFNKIVEGYTLVGFWITPYLNYKISDNDEISVGAHLIHFSGRDKLYKIQPVLSFTHNFLPFFLITIGTIDNSNNHYLIPPLYDSEAFYFNQADNGIQILYNSDAIRNDTWLSWDKFIFYGDTTQEELTFGHSSRYTLINDSKLNMNLKINTIAKHKGGQINRPKKPIETLLNLGGSIEFAYCFDVPFLYQLSVEPFFCYYMKPTSYESQPFNKGWAFYPSVRWSISKNICLQSSYWYSNKFITARGERIFNSVAVLDNNYFETMRKMIINKIVFFKKFGGGVELNAGIEAYYLNNEYLLDYNFYFQLNWKFTRKITTL